MGERDIPIELRRAVSKRARGRCEYCRIHESAVFLIHQIDHIVARKHGGETSLDNLALSCALCNKHKGSDIASIEPEAGAIVALFHPRRDSWDEHFALAQDGAIIPRTVVGRVTVRLLSMNHPDRVAERKLLFASGTL